MEQHIPLLLATPLFTGFTAGQLQKLLPLLAPAVRPCQKGETLVAAGSDIEDIGVVLAGEIEAVKFTQAGGMFTVSRMGPGGVFGDVLSSSHTKSPVAVTAVQAGQVMLFSVKRFFAAPANEAPLYRQLLANLVAIIADKYFALDARIDLLLTKSLKKRLAAYLLEAGRGHGTSPFTIPFTRAGLAAYLGCERSALSREVSHLVAEGLIETTRSRFRIRDPAGLRALFTA